MKLNKATAIPAIALAAGISLTACGSQAASHASPAVTHTVTAPAAAPKPSTAAPTTPAPTTPAPAPVKTVKVQAPAAPAPAAPVYSGANCGGGVYAGPNTSCAFALNVAADYNGAAYDAGPQVETVYSPVTGESYSMTYTWSDGVVTATGGNDASVQFPG
jgi:hypothetical protein